MNLLSKRTILLVFMVILFWGLGVGQLNAQSDYEFYFFGQNLKSFRGCNLFQASLGAVASVITHELGHALYLELSGKTWEFQTSFPSGLAVSTHDSLNNTEYQNFGRSGFALQTLIGLGLSTFEKTRHSDFTKGWVAINAAQVFSYPVRHDRADNDFEIIDKGGGNGNLEFAIVSFLSLENLRRLEPEILISHTKSDSAPDHEFAYNFDKPSSGTGDIYFLDKPPASPLVFLPETKWQNAQHGFTGISPYKLNSDFLLVKVDDFDFQWSGDL